VKDELEFFRDIGVGDLFLDGISPGGVPALSAGSMPDLPSLAKFVEGCPRCKLSKSRTNIVFGQGNPHAELMFVGEAPGRDEDEQGLAFVGRAGQLLTKIIEAMGKKREEVYIANCLKCRPPNNRNPEADEVTACRPFLEEQVRLISPKVIVTLGTFAAQALLETDEPIGRMRGRWRSAHGARVMPTFHPAFLLRSPERKKEVWEDMKLVRDYLAGK
jgi:DNA polymerase